MYIHIDNIYTYTNNMQTVHTQNFCLPLTDHNMYVYISVYIHVCVYIYIYCHVHSTQPHMMYII